MRTEQFEIITRVNAALDVAQSSDMRPHLEWEAKQLLSHIPPERMTVGELAALVAVLHAAHTRVLDPPGGRGPTLRIVTRKETPELAESAG